MRPQRALWAMRARLPWLLLLLAAALLGACATAVAPQAAPQEAATVDVEFTLRTNAAGGRLFFVGVGGAIDGVVNPTLEVTMGQRVRLTLVNDDGMPHDVVVRELNVASRQVSSRGASTTVEFDASMSGSFAYWCSISGHRQAGMEGLLVVTG